ncbi:MAG: hypothetical protein RIR89_1310 [Actinomycetota bacterium]|jgi:hypothetical protein
MAPQPSQESIKQEFEEIASNSCQEAQLMGIVEETEELGLTAVLVPKDLGIDGYSAAYFQEPDTYELIWETDFFFACSFSNQLALSEEFGQKLEYEIKKVNQDYVVTMSDFEGSPYETVYSATNGLLSSAKTFNQNVEVETVISYPSDLETSLQVIEEALRRFG